MRKTILVAALVIFASAIASAQSVNTFCPTNQTCTWTGTQSFTGALTAGTVNGVQIVGNGSNTNIAAAVTAAGTTGAVMIPPGYAGTDSASTSTASIIDFRQNSQGGVGFWHGTRSVFPVVNFPAGNDWLTSVFGPGDIHLANNQVDFTSTTTVNAGTTTITVGAGSSPNGGPTGTTSILSTASGVSLVLEPGTTNEETIGSGSWSVVSATQLSVTVAKTHTQPYTVRQQGVFFVDGRGLFYNVPTSGNFFHFGIGSGASSGVSVTDFPTNTSAAWPLAGITFIAQTTGGNGANSDFIFRQNNTLSTYFLKNSAGAVKYSLDNTNHIWINPAAGGTYQWMDSTNGNQLMLLSESSRNPTWALRNATNTPLTISAQTDLTRFLFGGSTLGAIFYGSGGGTGTSGIIRFRNNPADDVQQAQIDTSNGSIQVKLYQTNTNCSVNSVSPAACGTAAAGAVVVPTTTTSYTINTSAVSAASRIFLQPMSFAGNLPSSPTCVVPTTPFITTISAISVGVSFSFTLPSTTGQTCWQYFVVN